MIGKFAIAGQSTSSPFFFFFFFSCVSFLGERRDHHRPQTCPKCPRPAQHILLGLASLNFVPCGAACTLPATVNSRCERVPQFCSSRPVPIPGLSLVLALVLGSFSLSSFGVSCLLQYKSTSYLDTLDLERQASGCQQLCFLALSPTAASWHL